MHCRTRGRRVKHKVLLRRCGRDKGSATSGCYGHFQVVQCPPAQSRVVAHVNSPLHFAANLLLFKAALRARRLNCRLNCESYPPSVLHRACWAVTFTVVFFMFPLHRKACVDPGSLAGTTSRISLLRLTEEDAVCSVRPTPLLAVGEDSKLGLKSHEGLH